MYKEHYEYTNPIYPLVVGEYRNLHDDLSGNINKLFKGFLKTLAIE
jgi:hypothetical protein